jgi:hypothetical protein
MHVKLAPTGIPSDAKNIEQKRAILQVIISC